MTNFDLAFNYTFQNEGSKFVNEPDDSGGPTKYGITMHTYSSFFGSATIDDIRNMTSETARQIYHKLYWTPLLLDQILYTPAAIAIFDTGVLYGPQTSAKLAQKVLSINFGQDIQVDGLFGDKSVAAMNVVNEALFIVEFKGLVLDQMNLVIEMFPKNELFRGGWTRRAERLLTLNEPSFLMELHQVNV